MNRVLLIGNLTRDPELKYTPAGTAVCTFGVATNRSWTTAEGQLKEETQYHRIVAWQKLAELCGKLLTKGRKVFAEGRLTYRSFTGKDGQPRTVAEIVLDDFIVFGDGKRPTEEGEAAKAPGEVAAVTPAAAGSSIEDDFGADIPVESETAAAKKPKSEDVNPDDIPF
jgi:single-strand DNA-binding protein